MEEQNNKQNSQLYTEPPSLKISEQISTPPHKSSNKKIFLAITGVILLLVIFSGVFYYLGVNKNNSSSEITKTNTQTINSPVPTVSVISIAPITKNSVSYGYQGENLLMNYKNKVYSYNISKNMMNEPEAVSRYANVTWQSLVEAPDSVNEAVAEMAKVNGSANDEILNLSPLPNKNFVFVMRWDRIVDDKNLAVEWDLPIYYFDSATQSIVKLADNSWPNKKEYPVPFFNSASLNGENLAFNMFGCWNCGGHYPEIKLINVNTKASKNLGKVIEFKWTGDNSYSYKEYKEIECTEPQPGVCLEDASKLSVKTGTF